MIDSHSQPFMRRKAGDSRTVLVQVVKRRKISPVASRIPPAVTPAGPPAPDHG